MGGDMNHTVLLSSLLLVVFAASGQDVVSTSILQTERPDVAAGKQTYREYCAACHGENGKGIGPAASALKTPPSDLTTLARRHAGNFPEDYVTEVLRLGRSIQAHGSSDMPV